MGRTKTAETIAYLRAEVRRLAHLLYKNHWTPQEVEAETLRGYEEPWLTAYDEIVARKAAVKLSRATVMADWQIERLNAWNRAIVLGGKHYEEWRKAYIEPMEQRINSHTLWRHQISRLIEYERKWSPAFREPARSPASKRYAKRYPASDASQ